MCHMSGSRSLIQDMWSRRFGEYDSMVLLPLGWGYVRHTMEAIANGLDQDRPMRTFPVLDSAAYGWISRAEGRPSGSCADLPLFG